MIKEWTPKRTVAQKLNVLISCCDGLLLLLESSRRVSEEESQSVLLEKYVRKRVKACLHNLLCCPGHLPRQNGISHSHWMKYINSKLQRPKQFLHRIII